jgi:hypothetical protein
MKVSDVIRVTLPVVWLELGSANHGNSLYVDPENDESAT